MNRHRKPGLLSAAVVLLTVTLAPASQLAFSYVKTGEPLPSVTLATHDGGQADYLGDDTDRARVFAFLKGGHPRSDQVLAQLRNLRDVFADRPVSLTVVVSDRHGSAWADSLAARAGDVPVLIDVGDHLYGQMGVALSPSVGIGTAERTLHAYLPYQKLNYEAIIGAHIGFLLGDLDADALNRALHPTGTAHDTAEAAALRKLKLADMLLKAGKLDKARQQTEDALAEFPDLAAGYDMLAAIHTAGGDEAAALAAAEHAAALRAAVDANE